MIDLRHERQINPHGAQGARTLLDLGFMGCFYIVVVVVVVLVVVFDADIQTRCFWEHPQSTDWEDPRAESPGSKTPGDSGPRRHTVKTVCHQGTQKSLLKITR